MWDNLRSTNDCCDLYETWETWLCNSVVTEAAASTSLLTSLWTCQRSLKYLTVLTLSRDGEDH